MILDQATEVQRGRIEDLRGEFQDLETEWNQLCQTQVKKKHSLFLSLSLACRGLLTDLHTKQTQRKLEFRTQ